MNTEKKDYTLEELIEKTFDFSTYSAEDKKDMIAETAGLVMEAALLRALGEGGEKVQADFDTFIETEPDDIAMNEHVQTKVPKFQDFIVEELKTLKEMNGDTK